MNTEQIGAMEEQLRSLQTALALNLTSKALMPTHDMHLRRAILSLQNRINMQNLGIK